MPGGIVNEDDHLGIGLSWIASGHIMQMSRKGHLKAPGFALSGLLFDPRAGCSNNRVVSLPLVTLRAA